MSQKKATSTFLGFIIPKPLPIFSLSLLCVTITKYTTLGNVEGKQVCLAHSFGG
jgi:hypothetical protein